MSKAWKAKNKERIRIYRAAYYLRHKEEERKNTEHFKMMNPDYFRKASALVRAMHPEKKRISEASRRAARLKASPKWANQNRISDFYRNTPSGFEVDHIVPLRSSRVCGLHCEANLQYLSRRENTAKRNRHWPNMP